MLSTDHRHGRYAGYLAGCKTRVDCPAPTTCVDAERAYQNRRARDIAYGRPRKVPSIGSVRRIQALMRLGWTGTYLCELLDLRRPNLPVHTRYPTVRIATAEKIKQVYEDLLAADVEGPSQRTRDRAALHGFFPPQAWQGLDIDHPDTVPHYDWTEPTVEIESLDQIAIERAVSGERVTLTRAERIEAVKRLLDSRFRPDEIRRRLNLTERQFTRLLARIENKGDDLAQTG